MRAQGDDQEERHRVDPGQLSPGQQHGLQLSLECSGVGRGHSYLGFLLQDR